MQYLSRSDGTRSSLLPQCVQAHWETGLIKSQFKDGIWWLCLPNLSKKKMACRLSPKSSTSGTANWRWWSRAGDHIVGTVNRSALRKSREIQNPGKAIEKTTEVNTTPKYNNLLTKRKTGDEGYSEKEKSLPTRRVYPTISEKIEKKEEKDHLYRRTPDKHRRRNEDLIERRNSQPTSLKNSTAPLPQQNTSNRGLLGAG